MSDYYVVVADKVEVWTDGVRCACGRCVAPPGKGTFSSQHSSRFPSTGYALLGMQSGIQDASPVVSPLNPNPEEIPTVSVPAAWLPATFGRVLPQSMIWDLVMPVYLTKSSLGIGGLFTPRLASRYRWRSDFLRGLLFSMSSATFTGDGELSLSIDWFVSVIRLKAWWLKAREYSARA